MPRNHAPPNRQGNDPASQITNAIVRANEHVRTLETQLQTTPVRYTSVNGYLTADVSSGTTVNVSSVPKWMQNFKTMGFWLVIGIGTANCEVRKVADITGESVVTVTSAINKAHLEDDPIMFIDAPIINVKYFGAVGDATADDTAEIGSAFAEVQYIGATDGAVVYFPAGRYLVTSGIVLQSNTTILGEAIGNSRIFFNNSGGDLFALIGTSPSRKASLRVENMTFRLYTAVSTTAAMFNLDYVDYAYFKNVRFGVDASVGTYGAGDGLNASFCRRVQVESCTFKDCYQYGVVLNDCEHSQISNSTFETGRLAHIRINNCLYTTITGNISQASLTNGIELRTSDHLTVSGNQTQGNGTRGIDIDSACTNVTIAGNQSSEASKVSDIMLVNKGFLVDQDTRFLPSDYFQAVTGYAPTKVALGGVPTWYLPAPAAASTAIACHYAFPSNHGLAIPTRIMLYFVQDGAGAGSIAFRVGWQAVGNFGNMAAGFGVIAWLEPVPGTTQYQKIVDIGASYAPNGGDAGRFIIFREFGGGDSFAGGIWILGLELKTASAIGA